MAFYYTGGRGVYYFPHKLRVFPNPTLARTRSTIAAGAIGILGYSLGTNVDVFDRLGLADPMTARFRLNPRRPSVPGHEKPIPAPWAAARLVSPLSRVTLQEFPPLGYPIRDLYVSTPQSFSRDVRDARVAMQCDEVKDFMATYEGSMTPSRFVRNLVASFSNFSFEVAPDPAQARRELCNGHGSR
jgi:hypothetical protein